MKSIHLLLLLTVLFVTPYAFGQIPSCPCDTLELSNGKTGNDIVGTLCPGGNLAAGIKSEIAPDIVSIVAPTELYYVIDKGIDGGNGCAIYEEFIGIKSVSKFPDEVTESCRQRLIQGCNLKPATSPSPPLPPGLLIPIPTLSEWGMIAMAGVLGVIGLYVALRRRKAAA